MKLAAIDLGSNSIHMVVVEVDASGGFRVIGREKSMVRLGASGLGRRRLSTEAMERGIETLRKYRRLAEEVGVDTVLAVATSAVREARNGEDFLERVGREVGIWPRAVSGEEEARLIYLAALHSVHLAGRRTLLVDIGGGSVELVLGEGERVLYAASEKLGVLRMTERFVKSDPLSGRDEARLAEHVEKAIAPHVRRIQARGGFDKVVGTSGTILALGGLAHGSARGEEAARHHLAVKASALRAARKRLASSDLRARQRLAALDNGRADIVVAGAVVLDTILQALEVEELILCDWALREGIVLDHIQNHPEYVAQAQRTPDVRRRSVLALAERCSADPLHGQQVARLALALFDGTRRRHLLGRSERSLLEYAALLHDIGHHISYPKHHKHTYYLVKNGDLRGFTPLEVEVLANVARYHRRGEPRKRHQAFAALPRRKREVVRTLSALLRVADALDRSHKQIVREARLELLGNLATLRCEVEGDAALEQWGVPRRAELLERVLGVRLNLESVRLSPAPSERAAVVPWRPAGAV